MTAEKLAENASLREIREYLDTATNYGIHSDDNPAKVLRMFRYLRNRVTEEQIEQYISYCRDMDKF